MKRLTPARRERIRRKAEWSIYKRLRRRGYGRAYGKEVRMQNRFHGTPAFAYRTPGLFLELSGRLDMLNQPDATLAQLNTLAEVRRRGMPVRIRILLDDVTYIDAPSLLFLCSHIADLERRCRARVTGSWPKDPAALRALIDADFPGFLQGTPPSYDKKSKTLQLHVGSGRSLVSSRVAGDMKEFLDQLSPTLSQKESDHIYAAALECLENVRVHAYDPKRAMSTAPWYTVGLYDPVTRVSTVAVLDMGFGIPFTVRRHMSKLRKLYEYSLRPSHDLIEEASKGLRTETGERHRGKGLNSLRQFALERPGRRFHVLSSDGMVSWAGGEPSVARTIPDIEGTIVCLEMAANVEPAGPVVQP